MVDSSPSVSPPKSISAWLYVLGGLSFIPCVGVPFGIAAICFGIAQKAKPLAWIGAAGILFTFVLYGGLFYFGFYQRGGIYDDLRCQMAVTQLNESVRRIEYYKFQNGHYPAKITDIESKAATEFPSVMDPTAMERKDSSNPNFYYELDSSGSYYYLRSVGPDGIPFTPDDIVPTLSEDEIKKTGLKLQK